ncbi:MAG TPA: phosphodiester glycosidase family protein [Clostridia bacterium]|jgi:exopolysaccharide biosynthesis protein|nr:phosphodiester glycosidase family protein [Clostridia bacterium]
MRRANLLALLLMAPFLGVWLACGSFTGYAQDLVLPVEKTNISLHSLEEGFRLLAQEVGTVKTQVVQQKTQYETDEKTLSDLTKLAVEQKEKSDEIYETRILTMLGQPVKAHRSSRTEIKVFKLEELGYRGYIAKVKLFDPRAFKVVLAKDKLGAQETTLQAVKRTGALLGINGGGFYTEMRDGKSYAVHIGNVVIDGKLITPFNAYPGNLCFAGINKSGRVIGGVYTQREQLMALNPWQGVSFIPVLIKGGVKQTIPADWAQTNQPRTIIGEYANGDLIMIVVDGRQADWSSGVTLERLLDKLVELGVKEAYNLDGGGSSTFVYGGKVLNRPSDGSLRPVVTNIVILP